MRFVVAVTLACGPASSACRPTVDDDDDTPPRVLGVEPAGQTVPVSTTFRIAFSEALNEKTVDGDRASDEPTIVLVPRDEVDDAFLSDLANPPLSESRQEAALPLAAALVDGDTVVTVSPLGVLAANTAYTLLVSAEIRDKAGNPIVDVAGRKAPFLWEFSTDAGAPEVIGSDATSAAAPVVVPNRKRITVELNQPVRGVTTSSLQLVPVSVGAMPVSVAAILIDDTRTKATLVLAHPGTGCERLTPNATYELIATADIHGDGVDGAPGQALVPYAEDLVVGSACDLVRNTMTPPVVSAGEVSATIRFDTSKASTSEVRFGLVGGALDCLGGPCPVTGAAARVPVGGAVPPVFVHTVEIGGLTLGDSYVLAASAEDDVGFVAIEEAGPFATQVLPKVALNELMANPPAGAPEPAEEYIEIVNHGASPESVAGFVLEINGGSEAGGKSCSLPDVTLAAGAHVVLVGASFDGATYGAVDEALLVRGTGSSFCAALVNGAAQTFALKDTGGRVVSTMTAFAEHLPHDEGKSIERAAPDAADVAEAWCPSRTDVGPTPGRENGVVGRGCEQ